MSTLFEIEAAVNQLPRPEQQVLLEHLSRKLGAHGLPAGGLGSQRERWLEKLDRLRARGATGRTGAPLQDVFDDLRAERA